MTRTKRTVYSIGYHIVHHDPPKHVRCASHLAFNRAYEESTIKHKHAAVVFDGNDKIIAIGVNTPDTHAEINALERMPQDVDISKCTLVVVRASRNGCFAKSNPCDDCYRLIRNAGLRSIIFSGTNGFCISYI